MKCPKCKYEWKLPGQQKGGSARVSKGFANPAVQSKALLTRKLRKEERQNAGL